MSSDESDRSEEIIIKQKRRGFIDALAGAVFFGTGYLANDYVNERKMFREPEPEEEVNTENQDENRNSIAAESTEKLRDKGVDTPTENQNSGSVETSYPTDSPTMTSTNTAVEKPAETPTTTETVTATQNSGLEMDNPGYYSWENQENLHEKTGFCYIGEGDEYLGSLDAEDIESALEEGHFNGSDPNEALTKEELQMNLDDVTPVDGLYAVDVDEKSGDEDQFYVQLVGEEDGGLYITRQGAYEISGLEWEDIWSEC